MMGPGDDTFSLGWVVEGNVLMRRMEEMRASDESKRQQAEMPRGMKFTV